MTANELMAGDWVRSKKWDEKPFKLTCLNANWRYYYGITSNGVLVGPFLIEELEPIPLTPENLEKIGFKREGGASYWHEGDHDACIIHWSKDEVQLIIGCPSDDYTVKMNVKHVHELQHAFKLCGIEKEIVI